MTESPAATNTLINSEFEEFSLIPSKTAFHELSY